MRLIRYQVGNNGQEILQDLARNSKTQPDERICVSTTTHKRQITWYLKCNIYAKRIDSLSVYNYLMLGAIIEIRNFKRKLKYEKFSQSYKLW